MTSDLKPDVKQGFYKHFKGNVYQVFGVVKNTETEEWLVIYGNESPEYSRNIESFNSQVERNGFIYDRFVYVEEK